MLAAQSSNARTAAAAPSGGGDALAAMRQLALDEASADCPLDADDYMSKDSAESRRSAVIRSCNDAGVTMVYLLAPKQIDKVRYALEIIQHAQIASASFNLVGISTAARRSLGGSANAPAHL